MIPTTDGIEVNSSSLALVSRFRGFGYLNNIANYWNIEYCTGFNNVPTDILNVIGQFAAIKIFHILGDLIIGAGIASQSLSIDGLSQSIGTTSSATNAGYGARIQGYLKELKETLPRMQGKYVGVKFTVA